MAHIHELIDWVAGAYIVHGDTVLLRKHDKYNVWTHVGGHVELDEDPAEAVIRECKEEVGLDISLYDNSVQPSVVPEHVRHLPLPSHLNIHHMGSDVDTKHQHIDLIYYATSESNEVVPENDDDEWMWMTAAEIKDNPDIEPFIKHYALGALETLAS